MPDNSNCLGSERLPVEGKEILISTEGGSLYIGVLELIDDYLPFWYESQEYMTIMGVIAWMPLPEAYKEEVKQ